MAMTAEFEPTTGAIIIRADEEALDCLAEFNAAGYRFGVRVSAGAFSPSRGNIMLLIDAPLPKWKKFIKEWRR
jgi:hypothetical protein